MPWCEPTAELYVQRYQGPRLPDNAPVVKSCNSLIGSDGALMMTGIPCPVSPEEMDNHVRLHPGTELQARPSHPVGC